MTITYCQCPKFHYKIRLYINSKLSLYPRFYLLFYLIIILSIYYSIYLLFILSMIAISYFITHIHSYRSFNFAIASVVVSKSICSTFCIGFLLWPMTSIFYPFPYSYHYFNYCDNKCFCCLSP